MFSVRVLPGSKNRGEITIGGFTEQFACDVSQGSEFNLLWRSELRKLVGGAPSVALIHESRFAWLLYRVGDACFVQQVFARDRDFRAHLATRVTETEDGKPISEWPVRLSEIEEFLHEQSSTAV
jgi:hypothetical protein